MTTADSLLLAAVALLVLTASFLSGAEAALSRVNAKRAQALVDEGRTRAQDLVALVEHPERWRNPVLLAILACQLVQATLTGVLANRLFGPWGIAVAILLNVALVFVLTSAAPRTWAIQHPEETALRSARVIRLVASLWPLQALSRVLLWLSNRLLPGSGLRDGPYVTEEELLALAEVAVEEEVLEEEERELIESIIEFGDTVVREVMVPRPDMVTVDGEFRVVDVMEVALLNGYSRIPVCGDGIDDVIGIAFTKDLMKADRDGRSDLPVAELVRPPHFVPETKRVAELLPEMQSQQFHIAIVIDEYGGTAGLVTLEDLIEELVGEIVDEFDNEEAMVEPLPDGAVRVNARMPVDELNDLLHAELPAGDWNTIGGLMFHLLGHVPIEGETVTVDGHELRAERVQGRRIGRVRVTSVGSEDAAADR